MRKHFFKSKLDNSEQFALNPFASIDLARVVFYYTTVKGIARNRGQKFTLTDRLYILSESRNKRDMRRKAVEILDRKRKGFYLLDVDQESKLNEAIK